MQICLTKVLRAKQIKVADDTCLCYKTVFVFVDKALKG